VPAEPDALTGTWRRPKGRRRWRWVLIVARQRRAGVDGYIVQRHPEHARDRAHAWVPTDTLDRYYQHARRAGRRYAWPTTDDRQARRMVEALGLDPGELGL
jgi:hypothetical protein